MTTNEPETPGGKFLRDSLNASSLRSVGSLEAALANVLHTKEARPSRMTTWTPTAVRWTGDNRSEVTPVLS